MAYSLFLAALEHSRRDGAELTLTNAIDYLPTNVPILADLYGLVKKVASTIPTIYEATRLLVDQLNASEIERIHQKLVEHKPGEDPVIQFYEPFLKEYDPKEREARGVYYTPKPVVDYIVKSVDWILRNKFNKAKGLAEESVYLLDPATGTGTF
ncbi:MAG: N-6 DNA methylase [Candidatus Colwellbacteria bacterium]|nr:N-6 DNA methylase [Candidatus Colwellbacteria bacterium]